MKVAIFGAAGFLGKFLGKSLREREIEVVGYDINELEEDSFPLKKLDTTKDKIDIEEGTDIVFYLSQFPFTGEAYRKELIDVNFYGAIRVAEEAIRKGSRRFLYASTGNVYESSFKELREDWPTKGEDFYALSKILTEETLYLYQKYIGITILRFFGIFGPGQKDRLIPKIIGKIKRGEFISIERNPLNNRDKEGLRISLIYVEDAIKCLIELIKREDLPFVINVGGEESLSIQRVATVVAEYLRGKDKRIELVDRYRKSDYIADISLLKSLVSIEFTPFREALLNTIKTL